MKEFVRVMSLIAIFCAFLYSSFWLIKNGSYFFWYADMVKDTIQEMVKSDALKDH